MKLNRYLTKAFRALFVATIFSILVAGCSPPASKSNHDHETHGGPHADGLPWVIDSTTDLMGIVEAIAGDSVELHCFGKGNQDPHALDILPSFVREMNDADLWIQVGNDIEAGWYPDLIANVKNPKIV